MFLSQIFEFCGHCTCLFYCHVLIFVFCRYEVHYNTLHRYVCSFCHCHFPTQHLLDLHLLEWHDAMFELQSSSQKMVCVYHSCFDLSVLQDIM